MRVGVRVHVGVGVGVRVRVHVCVCGVAAFFNIALPSQNGDSDSRNIRAHQDGEHVARFRYDRSSVTCVIRNEELISANLNVIYK